VGAAMGIMGSMGMMGAMDVVDGWTGWNIGGRRGRVGSGRVSVWGCRLRVGGVWLGEDLKFEIGYLRRGGR